MIYLSIDVETSGPFPGLYSLCSIGAAPIIRDKSGDVYVDEEKSFYVELQPLEGATELPAATKTHGLSSEHLEENGLPPKEALRKFEAYYDNLTGEYGRVVSAAWPVTFDIPFVSWYAQKFLNRNFLTFNAFDIGSYALGIFRCSPEHVDRRMKHAGLEVPPNPNRHNALGDAIEQGHILTWLLNYSVALGSTAVFAAPRPVK